MALGLLKETRAVRPLTDLLEDSNASLFTKATAVSALADIGGPDAAGAVVGFFEKIALLQDSLRNGHIPAELSSEVAQLKARQQQLQ